MECRSAAVVWAHAPCRPCMPRGRDGLATRPARKGSAGGADLSGCATRGESAVGVYIAHVLMSARSPSRLFLPPPMKTRPTPLAHSEPTNAGRDLGVNIADAQTNPEPDIRFVLTLLLDV